MVYIERNYHLPNPTGNVVVDYFNDNVRTVSRRLDTKDGIVIRCILDKDFADLLFTSDRKLIRISVYTDPLKVRIIENKSGNDIFIETGNKPELIRSYGITDEWTRNAAKKFFNYI